VLKCRDIHVEFAEMLHAIRDITQQLLGLLHNGCVMRIGADEEEKFVNTD
jgi:hypothetical protein